MPLKSQGGGTVARHNDIRDTLYHTICEFELYADVLREQSIPHASSAIDAPRLDIVAQGRPGAKQALDRLRVGLGGVLAAAEAGGELVHQRVERVQLRHRFQIVTIEMDST